MSTGNDIGIFLFPMFGVNLILFHRDHTEFQRLACIVQLEFQFRFSEFKGMGRFMIETN